MIGRILALATLFLALATPTLAAESNGTIKGVLVNQTAGGSSVADQEVTLTTYKAKTESGKQTLRTDKDGKFTFSGLDTGADFAYLAEAQFQGAPYFSEPVTFTANSAEQSVQVKVSDTTSAEDVVKTPSWHFIVEPDPNGLSVSEIIILKNASDKTYVGSKEVHQGTKETLRFSVPAEAQEVQLGSGFVQSRAFIGDGAISDTWPVFPGDDQRIFQYRVPAKAGSASFTARITQSADKVSVLMPDVGAQISISNLTGRANPEIQGEKYVMLSGQSVAAGTELQFKVDDLSKVSLTSASSAAAAAPASAVGSAPLIVGVVAVGLVAAAAVVIRRRRSRIEEDIEEEFEEEEEEEDVGEAGAAVQGADGEDLEAKKEEMVAAIAQLDDSFEAGKISSEEYGRVRAQKKRQLVEVVARQRSLAGVGRKP